MPLSERLPAAFAVRILTFAALTHFSVLPCGSCLSRQSRLVNLERNGGNESDVRRYTVTNGECHQVSWEQGIGKRSDGLTVPIKGQKGIPGCMLRVSRDPPYQMTVMRYQLLSMSILLHS